MKHSILFWIILVLLSAAGMTCAATITVTSTADANTNDGVCTLREAVIAANTNSASSDTTGGCTAGENTVTDTISLQNGATYTLSIPGASEEQAYTGDLDILDNSVPAGDFEVIIDAGGGTATITWNPPYMDRILQVAGGYVRVKLIGITLTGGYDIERGGGIFNAGFVSLKNCVVTGNRSMLGGGIYTASGIPDGVTQLMDSTVSGNEATMDGGGIYQDDETGLDLINSVVISGNTAAGDGGGIYYFGKFTGSSWGAGTMVTVSGNTTETNGGGIYSDSSVTHPILLKNNRAGNKGGGIYVSETGSVSLTNARVIGNTCSRNGCAIFNANNSLNAISVHNSCITFNRGSAITNSTPSSQDATGNWWGASNGPSGSGPGSGDSVNSNIDFSGFLATAPAECRPAELVFNGDFQLDLNGNSKPDGFTLTKFAAGDKMSCAIPTNCSLKIKGNGSVKKMTQKILISGNSGDSLTLNIADKTTGIPTNGAMSVAAQFYLGSTLTEKFTIPLNPGTHDWEILALPITTTNGYDNVKIQLKFSKSSGTMYIDDLTLKLN